MKTDDYELKQAIASVAKLGGYTIKRVATSDDLKDRTLTITITRVSEGHHQERLPFEDVADQVATVDANGHVESLKTLDPSDLTEKDETLTDPDEGADAATIAEMHPGVATTVDTGASSTVLDLNSKKRR